MKNNHLKILLYLKEKSQLSIRKNMYIIKNYMHKKKIFDQILKLKKYYKEYYKSLYQDFLIGISQYQVDACFKFLYMLKKVILKQYKYIDYYNKKLHMKWKIHKNLYFFFKKICFLESYIYKNIKKKSVLKEQRLSDNFIETLISLRKNIK